MKELDYGKDYKYAHSYEGNFAIQEFLPDQLSNTKIYQPGNNQREQAQQAYLKSKWKDKYGY